MAGPRPPDIAPLVPTAVYDTYWRFAAERQRIFTNRFERRPAPWTYDPVLQAHKFTNAYRASDRVSQYLIRRVIYRDDLPADPAEVVFRVLLFKLFNRVETWETLEAEVGPPTHADFSFERYDRVLTEAAGAGRKIYSGAYIMPSAGGFGYDRKHRNHLTLLERMVASGLPGQLAAAPDMRRAFGLIRAYPTLGDFLAYQYVTDINYSPVTDFGEGEFVVPGPGALDGIRKCFLHTGELSDADVIRFMADRQEREFERLGLDFRPLWGRRLQLIDCQNLFCEVDKYARVAHPQVGGLSGRTRIKQRFRPNPEPIEYWYPPKWGLNDLIARHSIRPAPPQTLFPSPTPESFMDLSEYQRRAAGTDRNPGRDNESLMIPLAGLAGETGELLGQFKKYLRDGDSHKLFKERLGEEVGDILWYLSNVASKFGLDLAEVAGQNLAKCEGRWGELSRREPFDVRFPEGERFPRRFLVDFATIHDKTENPVVRVYYQGVPFGNELNDNARTPDGYAYHDALHLAFAAVLGWSPLVRKLLKAKRKSDKLTDDVEDGARAVFTEEGLAAMIFAYARDYNFLDGKSSVSTELLRMVRNMTAHMEVSACTPGEWERAIVEGFRVWRSIKATGAGTLILNLDERSVTLKDRGPEGE